MTQEANDLSVDDSPSQVHVDQILIRTSYFLDLSNKSASFLASWTRNIY